MINTDLVTDVSTPSTIPGSDTQVGIEINPAVAELGSNLGSGDTVVSAPRPTVRTFQPSNSLEPMLEEAGNIVSLGAYLTEESLYRAIYDGLEEPEFQRDSTFDAAKTLQQDKEAVKLNPDFQKELLGSVSNDDYKYRWGRIRDKQIAQTAMSEAPVGAFVGAVTDADLLLGLGVTKAVRTIGLATRIGAPYSPSVIAGTRRSLAAGGAVLGGAVVGSASYSLGRSNEEVLWDAVGGAVGGLLDGFTAVPKAAQIMPTVQTAATKTEKEFTLDVDVLSDLQMDFINQAKTMVKQDTGEVVPDVYIIRTTPDGFDYSYKVQPPTVQDYKPEMPTGLRATINQSTESESGNIIKGAEVEVRDNNGKLVGVIQAADTGGGNLNVFHTWVDSKYRGKGIARRMYAELGVAAKEGKYSTLNSDSRVTDSLHRYWVELGATRSTSKTAVSSGDSTGVINTGTYTTDTTPLYSVPVSSIRAGVYVPPPKVLYDKASVTVDKATGEHVLTTGNFGGLTIKRPAKAVRPVTTTVNNVPTVPDAQREAIDTFNPGFSQYVASWDKLHGYSPDLANKLLANPMDDVAESAVVWGRSTWLEADRALYGLEQAIKAEVPRWKSWFPQTRARARAETAELGRAARQWLNTAQQIEARGGVPVPPTDPRIKRIVDAYTEGNFGTVMGTRAQEAGVFGADALSPSKYYVPVRHSYLKMQEFVAQGKGSWTDLHKMYGQQIARIYPRLITPVENGGLGLSPEALGKKFVYTQKLRQADPKAQAFRGTTQDELAEVLRAEGVEEGKIKGLLSTLQPKADEAGKQKNLRTRMDWDYEGTYLGTKGQVMSINEFMDDDLLGSLQTYARNMSGRIGLARMGFTKESELDDAIGKALDNLPAAERQKAQEFFGNVKAQLLGQPVGEAAPDWFRTLTSYGASTQLGNSGIYAIADYAQLVNEFVVSTVAKHFLKHFLKGLSGVINAKSITKGQAETIQQVISGQLFAEGRVRPYVTHLEDNWVGPAGSIHEVVQYGGQYIKYLNGSEFMRRHQINTVAGIMDELVGNLADVRKAEASAKYFRSLNMSDTDIAEATAQVQKHGTVIDNWDAAVKAKMMNTLISATDNIAITIRAGEQPAFIEHSAIGRVLFPYMRYVFGANQKILRRNYKRNGVMGVALYMSAAIPLSVVSGMMSNIIQGRDPEEDLVARTIRSLPGLGVASLAADGFIQGDVGGTAPVFAGPNNLFQMADKLKRGELEVQDVLKAAPGANVFLPTRWLINSTKED